MKKFIQESWLILVLGIVFAVLLAGAQTTLAPRIQDNQNRSLNEAIGEVVPGAVTTEIVPVSGYDRNVFRCFDAGKHPVGWAVEAVGNGFADKIRLVVGLTPDTRRISGLKVIENIETPGLGNKIAEDDPKAEGDFPDHFKGSDASRPHEVKKNNADKDKNEIQAITGATISSKAVTDIVDAALVKVRPEIEKKR